MFLVGFATGIVVSVVSVYIWIRKNMRGLW